MNKSDTQLRAEMEAASRIVTANRRILRERKRKKIGLSASKGRGCRVSDRNEALKAERGYTNPRSFVRRDGSERLYGEDWKKRKREIWERGGGICEKKYFAGERCPNEMDDPHHIVKRSTRRDDRASNLIGLCRMHHDLLRGQIER